MAISTTVASTTRDRSVALAIEVIRDRLQGLPSEDVQDLHDLWPALFSDDPEESAAAERAFAEILTHQPSSLRLVAVEPGVAPLEQWVRHVSVRIRDLRKQRNLTQEQLAAAAGIPQSYISRLENGEHSPTAKTIDKLSQALQVSATEIDPSAK